MPSQIFSTTRSLTKTEQGEQDTVDTVYKHCEEENKLGVAHPEK